MGPYSQPPFAPFLSDPWVNETLSKLSPEQRIAQLLHVPAWSNRDESHLAYLTDMCSRVGVGGIIFFQGDPLSQARMTNRCQELAPVPLIISIDAEWGLAMRLPDTVQYPYAMTLGAVDNEELVCEVGAQIARQCRRLGVHINHAPDADINTEAANPVIGFRSFGAEKEKVLRLARAYMQGMQNEGVLAVAKHFPGHGDTRQDSHLTLPQLLHDLDRLRSIEGYPFRGLIEAGIGAVMTAHVQVPALDDRPLRPATLSKAIITDYLQGEMGFEGLVFTDALDMKGISAHYGRGVAEREALLAGNDVLLFCLDPEAAIREIQQAVAEGLISQAEIDRRCRKQLAAKRWLHLHEYQPVNLEHLVADLNPPEAAALNRKLAAAAVKVLHQQPDALPLKPGLRTAVLALYAKDKTLPSDSLGHHELTRVNEGNTGELTAFQEAFPDADYFTLSPSHSEEEKALVINQLSSYDQVLAGLHRLEIKAVHQFGITPAYTELVDRILSLGNVFLCVFANAYTMPFWPQTERAQALLLTFQETRDLQEAAAAKLRGSVA